MTSERAPLGPAAKIEVAPDGVLARISFRGRVTANEMQALREAATHRLPSLRAGATVLVDLTGLEKMELSSVPALTAVMDALHEAGVRRVIRVIPDRRKDIGLNILSLIHYRGDVPTDTVATVAEAKQKLTSPEFPA